MTMMVGARSPDNQFSKQGMIKAAIFEQLNVRKVIEGRFCQWRQNHHQNRGENPTQKTKTDLPQDNTQNKITYVGNRINHVCGQNKKGIDQSCIKTRLEYPRTAADMGYNEGAKNRTCHVKNRQADTTRKHQAIDPDKSHCKKSSGFRIDHETHQHDTRSHGNEIIKGRGRNIRDEPVKRRNGDE